MPQNNTGLEDLFIISLGGSLIVPEEIDWDFLKRFRELIISQIKQGKRFVIITGGGYIAREYQAAAANICPLTDDDMDWLGIHATRMNAHLIKTIFREFSHPRINKNPRTRNDLTLHFSNEESIVVAAGWRPGWSTDYVATILAERFSASTVINLSNVKFVYNKDPKLFDDAQKIKKINWADFRSIVGNRWDPGLNLPFDPIAARNAQEQDLRVIIADGKNLDNLEKILQGETKFQGTLIEGG